MKEYIHIVVLWSHFFHKNKQHNGSHYVLINARDIKEGVALFDEKNMNIYYQCYSIFWIQ